MQTKEIKMRHKEDFKIADFYEYYRNYVQAPVKPTVFSKVVIKFFKSYILKLYESNVMKLPARIGEMYIRKKDIVYKFDESGKLDPLKNRHLVDWGKTNKLWTERPDLKRKLYLYFENKDFNGKVCSLRWISKHSTISNINLYNFIPSRSFKRNLAKYIREHKNIDYYGT